MATAFGTSASATEEHAGGTDTITITKPASTVEGDFLVAVLGINGSAAGFSLAGWTTLFTANDATNFGIRGFVKVAGGSEPADYAFSTSGSAGNGMAGFIARITGSSFSGTSNALSATDVNTSATTTHTFSSGTGVTPASLNSIYLHGSFVRGDGNQSTYAITNNNPSWTEREDASNSGFTLDAAIAFATATPSAASASGDWTLTISNSREAAGFLISVQENSGGNAMFMGANF